MGDGLALALLKLLPEVDNIYFDCLCVVVGAADKGGDTGNYYIPVITFSEVFILLC